jgi:hypothetical protein
LRWSKAIGPVDAVKEIWFELIDCNVPVPVAHLTVRARDDLAQGLKSLGAEY